MRIPIMAATLLILTRGGIAPAEAQTSIKWSQSFADTTLPAGWQVIDNDGSGNGLRLFTSVTPAGGPSVLPHSGGAFWSSNYQNANLAGVIDEWLISPQISVIYAGDSLYFWAGAVGGPFNDSIRVLVSTTDDSLSSFTLLGYFRVDGPPGSWHRYGFSLAAFDTTDIYFAINYFIRDGGPGGQHSDFVWIDDVSITGDPSTINSPPTAPRLLEPYSGAWIHPSTDSIRFRWSRSLDADPGDTLRYTFRILDAFPQISVEGIPDTVFSFRWRGVLDHYAAFRWTIRVTDGRSRRWSPDTLFFITPPIENLPPFGFNLVSPANNDSVMLTTPLTFRWRRAVDPNSDSLTYRVRISGNSLDTTFAGTPDTLLTATNLGFLQAGRTYQWSVSARDTALTTQSNQTWAFRTRSVVGVDENPASIPSQFALHQAYPNPFNPTTTIRFDLPVKAYISLNVYNLIGQEVTALVDEVKAAGRHSIHFNAADLPGGVYFYRLEMRPQDVVGARQVATGKALLIK
jgi:hypothetical protein